jgi:hypothetical protein
MTKKSSGEILELGDINAPSGDADAWTAGIDVINEWGERWCTRIAVCGTTREDAIALRRRVFEGLATGREGRGTAVAPHTATPAADRAVSERQAFESALEAAGHEPVKWNDDGDRPLFREDAAMYFGWQLARESAALPADRAELAAECKRLALVYMNQGAKQQKLFAAIDALARSTDAPSGLPVLSEHAVLHALDMARTESHKQGDRALWMAFAEALRRQWSCMPRIATPPAAATSTPCASGEADEIAKLRAQVEELQAEVDDLNVNDERDVWPDWASAILKTVREYSGYDGYDDQDGIDLPAEVSECLAELNAIAERANKARDEALAATQAPAVPASSERAWVYRLNLLKSCANWLEARSHAKVLEIQPDPVEGGGYASLMRNYAQDLRTIREVLARTPTAGNTEDARSMGAVSDTQMLDFLARLGDFSAGSVPSIPHDYEVRTEDDRVFKGESLRGCIRAALTQAASTGGAAS